MVAPRNPALSCLCYVCNFCVFRTVTSSSHGWGFELPTCASRVSLCLSFGLVCKWRHVLLVLLVSRYRGVSLSTLAPHTSRRKGLVFTVSVARSASVITCFSTSRGQNRVDNLRRSVCVFVVCTLKPVLSTFLCPAFCLRR